MTAVEQIEALNARARTAKQLERQERVFALHVLHDKSVRAIAADAGIAQGTVISDLRYEQQRRADELGERRDFEKARAAAFYGAIIARAIRKSDAYDRLLQRALDDPTYELRLTDRSLDAALKARERIDKILGLDAPTRIDVGLATLLEALDVPEDSA